MNTKTKVSKKRSRAILSILLIAAILITGAFAFLIAQDSKTNVFTVGNVSIKLTERFDTDLSGSIDETKEIYDSSDERITLTDGKSVVPGQKIIKQPYITNNGKNNAYVYMVVGIPNDTSGNVYNGSGSYAVPGGNDGNNKAQITVAAYAIQENYKEKTTAADTWNAYFDKGSLGTTADDSNDRVEIFNLYHGSDANNLVAGVNSNWTKSDTVVTAGVTYHIYRYVNAETNDLLQPETSTVALFDYVSLNENVGGDTPPQTQMVTINYLIPEADTTTLAGEINLATNYDIPDGYNLVESKTVMPGESIGDVYWDVSLDKSVENKTCEYIDEETGETIYSNQNLYKDTNAILTYSDAGYENIVPQKYLCFSSGKFIGVHSSYWTEVNVNNEPCTVIVPSTLDYSQADILGEVSGVNNSDNVATTFAKTSIGCFSTGISTIESYKSNRYKDSVVEIGTTWFIIDNPENLYTATRTPEYDGLSDWVNAGFDENPETYRYTLKEEYRNAQISVVIPSSVSYISFGDVYLDFVAPNVFGSSGDRGSRHDAHRFTPINNVDVAFGTTYFSCDTLVNNITLPASLTEVGHIATKQSEISIPDGVSIIKFQCFDGSNGFVKNITLPQSLQNIDCASLPSNAKIYYQGTMEEFESCMTDEMSSTTSQQQLETISASGRYIICSDGFVKDGYIHYTTETPDEHLTEIVESLPYEDEIGMVWAGSSHFSCDCGYSYGVSTYL